MKKNLAFYTEITAFLDKALNNFYEIILFEYKKNTMKPLEVFHSTSINVKKVAAILEEYLLTNKEDILHQTVPLEITSLRNMSVHFIKDSQGNVEGALCVSLDMMPFLKLSGIASEFLGEQNEEDMTKKYPITFAGIDEYLEDNYNESEVNKKDLIVEVVVDLYDLGMFTIKGSVAYVADKLNISAKTLYRYIAMIKEHR